MARCDIAPETVRGFLLKQALDACIDWCLEFNWGVGGITWQGKAARRRRARTDWDSKFRNSSRKKKTNHYVFTVQPTEWKEAVTFEILTVPLFAIFQKSPSHG